MRRKAHFFSCPEHLASLLSASLQKCSSNRDGVRPPRNPTVREESNEVGSPIEPGLGALAEGQRGLVYLEAVGTSSGSELQQQFSAFAVEMAPRIRIENGKVDALGLKMSNTDLHGRFLPG